MVRLRQQARLSLAAAQCVDRLSPQERAALVFKEMFDMTLEEIAVLLATTTGAVKAALHRGRDRLREPECAAASRQPVPSPELVDRFIERFNAKDVKGLTALMLDGATAENVGNSVHVGLDPGEGIPRFLHAVVHGPPAWPPQFRRESARLERVQFEGEPIVLAFRTHRGRQALGAHGATPGDVFQRAGAWAAPGAQGATARDRGDEAQDRQSVGATDLRPTDRDRGAGVRQHADQGNAPLHVAGGAESEDAVEAVHAGAQHREDRPLRMKAEPLTRVATFHTVPPEAKVTGR